MTIKRDPATRDWVLTCDSCKTDERFAPSTAFVAIVRWINKQFWKARQAYERWRHYCPTCLEAERSSRLDQRVDRDRLHA